MEVYSNPQTGPLPGPPGSYLSGPSAHNFYQIKELSLIFQHTSTVECRSCVVYAQDNNSLPVWFIFDRIPSTTPGADPPRDARDSGSARSHSTHLETSSSDRPKMVTYTEPQTVPSYMSVKCTRQTLRMPNFTRATHTQPSLSNFPKWDSNFGEPTHSRRTTLWDQNFPTSPQNKNTKLTHCSIYTSIRTISFPQIK